MSGAENKLIDGAPAVLWHRINGRLTDNDIAQTICDEKDNPIGIYMGVWTPDWAKGGQLRTYAAVTDARDESGDRLYQSFNAHALYLETHPNGQELAKVFRIDRAVTCEDEMEATICNLQPGERTGWMIPPYEILRGEKHPGQEVTHPNNMYALRFAGDFAKANNGGYDSRFVMEEAGFRLLSPHSYVSSTNTGGKAELVDSMNFANGFCDWGSKDINTLYLRAFIAEMPKP